MFRTTPLTRNFGGECGSVATCRRSDSSRSLEHHTWPNERKKRCSGVKPSIFFAVFPMVFISAISATRTPPLSAVFSPSVSLPLICTPGATVKLEYSSSTQAAVIRRVFAQREFAVDMHARRHGEARVFIVHAGRALLELLGVGGGPPVL